MLVCMGVVNVFADKQVTIDLSANYGTETGVALTTEDFDDLTLTFAANGGTAPIYNYNHFRLYTDNSMTITAKNGKKIVSILFNYAAKASFKTYEITPDTYTYEEIAQSQGTIKGSDSEAVTITNKDAANVRIISMIITLNDGGAAAADPEEFNFADQEDYGAANNEEGTAFILQGENVTFTWTKAQDDATLSKFNYNHIRFYANNNLTISSENYNIASVEFKYVTGNTPQKAGATLTVTPDTYTYNENFTVLSGTGANTVTINTTKQIRITYIKVIFESKGGEEPSDIDIHDNYAMMPTVKVTDWAQLPEQKHPNYIYYVNSESTIGQEPTDVNVVLMGGAVPISYAITINEGYPFENVLAYHCGVWYEHEYTERLHPVYMPYDLPMPTPEYNNVKAYTFEGVQGDAFSFVEVAEPKAYNPYLIIAEAKGDSVTVYDASYGVRNMPISPKKGVEVTVGDYTFCGTNLGLTAEEMAGATYYVVSGEEWVKTTEPIKPLTSYIKTTLTDAPDSFKTLADGSLVTGIESVVAQPSSLSPQRSGIYTIDGRCLGTSEKALPHGIYIIDGKKVVR